MFETKVSSHPSNDFLGAPLTSVGYSQQSAFIPKYAMIFYSSNTPQSHWKLQVRVLNKALQEIRSRVKSEAIQNSHHFEPFGVRFLYGGQLRMIPPTKTDGLERETRQNDLVSVYGK